MLFKIDLFITRGKIRKHSKNNKLKITAPTWNNKLESLDGSYSVTDIQDYIKYIIKKHEELTPIPLIYVYINRINNSLVFKTKDGYKLELQCLKFIRQRKWRKTTKS